MLQSFHVTSRKAVHLAHADSVPPVMVIAGPNGVGKSTLLYAIKEGAGKMTAATKCLYQGPHRVLRRTQVRRSWLGGQMRRFLDLLSSGGDVSGYEGLNLPNSARTPDNVDEAGSTIKHTLGKRENRRQALLARLLDRKRDTTDSLRPADLPDVYAPLKTLTRYLLPHLCFDHVDFTDEDNVRCLWSRTDRQQELKLDIDDLSSGEKFIIILFLPFLEDRIHQLLHNIEVLSGANPTASVAPLEDRVILIDEPEQHLHPDLQAKILVYMRNETRDGKTQFILTTHSPTILDQAYDDELYVLSPPTEDGQVNQLQRVANTAERLEALRGLAGSAYFLTTGRALVCIEGNSGRDSDHVTDLHLLPIMYPRAASLTLVPTHGKGNVINTVNALKEHLPENTFRIRVRGLVDADRSTGSVPGVELLPVCMIENFLVHPATLLAYAQSQHLENLATSQAVAEALSAIYKSMEEDEVSLRVQRALPGFTVRLRGSSPAELSKRHAELMDKVQSLLPAQEKLSGILEGAKAEVADILRADQAAVRFRGKEILKRFHATYVASRNIPYAVMCLDLARRVGDADLVSPRLDPVIDRLLQDC